MTRGHYFERKLTIEERRDATDRIEKALADSAPISRPFSDAEIELTSGISRWTLRAVREGDVRQRTIGVAVDTLVALATGGHPATKVWQWADKWLSDSTIRVTGVEISQVTGYSSRTVSRFMNGRGSLMGPNTPARIAAAMESLGIDKQDITPLLERCTAQADPLSVGGRRDLEAAAGVPMGTLTALLAETFHTAELSDVRKIAELLTEKQLRVAEAEMHLARWIEVRGISEEVLAKTSETLAIGRSSLWNIRKRRYGSASLRTADKVIDMFVLLGADLQLCDELRSDWHSNKPLWLKMEIEAFAARNGYEVLEVNGVLSLQFGRVSTPLAQSIISQLAAEGFPQDELSLPQQCWNVIDAIQERTGLKRASLHRILLDRSGWVTRHYHPATIQIVRESFCDGLDALGGTFTGDRGLITSRSKLAPTKLSAWIAGVAERAEVPVEAVTGALTANPHQAPPDLAKKVFDALREDHTVVPAKLHALQQRYLDALFVSSRYTPEPAALEVS